MKTSIGSLAGVCLSPVSSIAAASNSDRAKIAITLDLEMSAQYPVSGMTEWNYQKGNLDEDTKRYSAQAGEIVASYGGVLHYFCVGRVLEQPDPEWLQQIGRKHPVGNHTYDHVNIKAKTAEATQFRFKRAPWLVQGRNAREVIRHNIELTRIALKQRAGIAQNGFRTPGGFHNGLSDRPDLQGLLKDLGFTWVSSHYPRLELGGVGQQPTDQHLANATQALRDSQPYRYPNGLIEIPMSPISDVHAFRSLKWKRAWYLDAIGRLVDTAIEERLMFDFLAHPSCLVVEDPQFEILRLICQKVQDSAGRAEIVGLDRIAKQTQVK